MTDDLIGDRLEYSPEFERFWKPWPKKSDKRRAAAKFEALSRGEQHLATLDAEKRKREGWWATHPLMLALSYLNGARWEDEWIEELTRERRLDTGKPDSGVYIPRPSEPLPEIPWPERMLSRLYVFWQCVVLGVSDGADAALEIKHTMLATDVPAYLEDIEADKITKRKAAHELSDVFLSRLDLHYHQLTKNRVLRMARKTV